MNYPTIDLVATGKRIQQLRKEKHLKVREISDYMGFTEPQAVYKWQRGDTLPTVDNLYALSVLFETPMDEIIIVRERQEEAEIASSFCVYKQVSELFTILKPAYIRMRKECDKRPRQMTGFSFIMKVRQMFSKAGTYEEEIN